MCNPLPDALEKGVRKQIVIFKNRRYKLCYPQELDTKDAYLLELAAPGMTKQDFNVHLDEDGDLVINMDHKEAEKKEEHTHYLRREFSYTKFQQTMLLPEDADREAVSAKVENGVLTVNIPKIKKVELEKAKKEITVE